MGPTSTVTSRVLERVGNFGKTLIPHALDTCTKIEERKDAQGNTANIFARP